MNARVSVALVLIAGLLGLAPAAAQAADPHGSVHDPSAFRAPIDGARVISHYGHRHGRRHEGIDLKAGYRTPIWAAFRGKVIQAGPGLRGYGNTVTIDHGEGVVTRYAHLAGWAVKAGQWVEQGDHIGSEGRSGRVTTNHLHYEVLVHGQPRNPQPYL